MKEGTMAEWIRFVATRSHLAWLVVGIVLLTPLQGFAADTLTVTLPNNTGAAAAGVTVTFSGTGGDLSVVAGSVIAPPGCPAPTIMIQGSNTVVITFGAACIPNGATVTFTVTTANGPLDVVGGNWTNAAGDNTGSIGAGVVPVKAVVRSVCGGGGALQDIGTIVATTGGAKINATFTFHPAFRYLDKWYDFRWINLIVGLVDTPGAMVDTTGNGCCDYVVPATGLVNTDGDGTNEVLLPYPFVDCPPAGPANNCPSGTLIAFELPAIDPQPGQIPPAAGADGQPYYWDTPVAVPPTGFEFAAHHIECLTSTFSDSRAGANYTFNTFLVIDAVTAPGLPANTFWVLDGFSWTSTLAGVATFTGVLAPDPATIDTALQNTQGNGAPPPPAAFAAWDAAPRADCPLQACPTPLVVVCTSIGFDPNNPECCLFNWTVTHTGNAGDPPITEFYMDLEAGTGGPCKDPRQPGPDPPVPAADISLPGWTASYCYLWDNNPISNWAVVCFMAGDATPPLQPGDSQRGTLSVKVNGPLKVDANFPDWHRFSIPPHSIHCHVTDYSPLCLGVDCGLGQFGPHIANDIHGRDQSCFWSAGGDWTWKPCPWDVNRDRFVNVLDLIDVLLCFGQPAAPDCGQEDINQDGAVNVLDLVQLLLHFGEACPQPPPPINNDNCFERRPITDGLRPFDTTLATTDGLPTNGLNDCAAFEDPQIHNDIWYNYVASCSGQLIVSTCNDGNPGTGEADYDTKIAIYDGCDLALCPFGGNEIGCNDDGPECAGLTSVAQAPVIAGNCYKIRVGGFGPTSAGTGVLSVQCIP